MEKSQVRPIISFLIFSWQAPTSLDFTIASIASQDLSLCEVILVNNGFSEERADELSEKYKHIGLKIVDEPRPGLGFARMRGFSSSRGDAIVMLDDDNCLVGDFVAELLSVFASYPNWGGICSAVIPVWEVLPPTWLQDFGKSCLSYNTLSVGEIQPGVKIWRSPDLSGYERPPGGGMIVRRDVFQTYLEVSQGSDRIDMDRKGSNLQGCQDADIYHQVIKCKRDAVKTGNLIIEHHIPSSRLRFPYLWRLNFQMTLSNVRLMKYWRSEGTASFIPPLKDRWWRLLMIFLGVLRLKTKPGLFVLEMARESGYLAGARKFDDRDG